MHVQSPFFSEQPVIRTGLASRQTTKVSFGFLFQITLLAATNMNAVEKTGSYVVHTHFYPNVHRVPSLEGHCSISVYDSL